MTISGSYCLTTRNRSLASVKSKNTELHRLSWVTLLDADITEKPKLLNSTQTALPINPEPPTTKTLGFNCKEFFKLFLTNSPSSHRSSYKNCT